MGRRWHRLPHRQRWRQRQQRADVAAGSGRQASSCCCRRRDGRGRRALVTSCSVCQHGSARGGWELASRLHWQPPQQQPRPCRRPQLSWRSPAHCMLRPHQPHHAAASQQRVCTRVGGGGGGGGFGRSYQNHIRTSLRQDDQGLCWRTSASAETLNFAVCFVLLSGPLGIFQLV